MTVSKLYRIDLELAREPGHPAGDHDHNYRLYLPLDAGAHIDTSALPHMKGWCRVVRHLPGEEEARGRIVRGPGGRWVLDFVDNDTRDDEIGFRLLEERFVPGEYVSIQEDDGRQHTFKVVSVRPD